MNKFLVFPCLNTKGKKQAEVDPTYDGPLVTLVSAEDESLVLFFPMDDKNAMVINYILENEKYDKNTEVLGVYQTMLDSWNASDRFLSGVLMDATYDDAVEDDIITIRFILSSNRSGHIDTIVQSTFIHAIIVAAMEKLPIIMTSELLHKLMPGLSEGDEDEDEDEDDGGDDHGDEDPGSNEKSFPVDEDILKLAKDIMGGQIK